VSPARLSGLYDADVETVLADLAREEIARRFGEHRPEIGEGSCVARFTCPSGSLGDVVVELDVELDEADQYEPGLFVSIEGWAAQGHYEGSPEEIVAECADFLEELFDDRVVVWVARKDGRTLVSGWFPRDVAPTVSYRHLSRDSDALQAGTWSAPWVGEWADPEPFQEGLLADLMRAEIARRFGDPHPEIADGWALPGPAPQGSRVAAFTCPTPSLGGVVVEADDFTVVVRVVDIWYTSFGAPTPKEAVGRCARLLDDFFDDRIVAWIAHHGERRLGAGFFYRRADGRWAVDGSFRRASLEADNVRARTWTAPWADSEIPADG
jgi:hypothetical protein